MSKINKNKKILIIGGLGFIGANAAYYFNKKHWPVTVLDNYSRQPGSYHNEKWLKRKMGMSFVRADIRLDQKILLEEVEKVDVVIHLAAQVAVTSSVETPRDDFENNALGTLNVLEAIRLSKKKPILIFSSTNKVYGSFDDVKIVKATTGYKYLDYKLGIDEGRSLDFHSPYGCSKGSADQYVRDYARIYGLRTVVFRQSCIYGIRQFGSEDQGWVAWFVISAVLGRPINIYGDGFQVRDLLYVDDLLKAYELAIKKIKTASGQIYNLGGGVGNCLCPNALVDKLNELSKGCLINPTYEDWRPGDQRIFVSDTRKAYKELGWEPLITVDRGLKLLFNWVAKNKDLFC